MEAIAQLVDTLLEVVNRKKYELSPVINSYNTIKIAVLMYKVTYLIEKMNLFSMVTKCRKLRTYIN